MRITTRRIIERRKALGIQQKDLARATGLSQAQISRYETGSSPTVESLVALARALKTTIDYLAGVTDDPIAWAVDIELSNAERQVIDALRVGDYKTIIKIASELAEN